MLTSTTSRATSRHASSVPRKRGQASLRLVRFSQKQHVFRQQKSPARNLSRRPNWLEARNVAGRMAIDEKYSSSLGLT